MTTSSKIPVPEKHELLKCNFVEHHCNNSEKEMVTFGTKIKVLKPLKIFGALIILFFIWIIYNYRSIDIQNSSEESVYGGSEQDPTVRIDVYYECLCPDSRYFVLHELIPTYEKVGSLLDVNLWAYGKASSSVVGSGGYKFECQHGEDECIGNIYHNCVVEKVKDVSKRLDIIKCMISDNYEPKAIAQKCSNEVGIDFNEISECASGKEGQELHYKAGVKTEALNPSVSFIPTIEIEQSQDSQKAILKNLLKEVCKAYSKKYLSAGEKLVNCP